MKARKSWLVLNVSAVDDYGVAGSIPETRRPTVLQYCKSVANDEAKRLASENPGCVFMVLEATSSFVKQDVVETRL